MEYKNGAHATKAIKEYDQAKLDGKVLKITRLGGKKAASKVRVM